MQPTIGDNISRFRRAMPMTQEALAEAAGVSVETVRKLEQNERTAARMSTLNRLARALRVPTSRLVGDAARAAAQAQPDIDQLALLEFRRALTPAIGLGGAIAGGVEVEPPTLDDVRSSIRVLDRAYHAEDYATAVTGLPLLIAEARTAVQETSGDDQAVALELMAQTYQLAGTTLTQLRAFDLAHRALTAAIEAADRSGNQVIGASAVTVMCWLLLRQGRFGETESLAVTTADAVEPSFYRSDPAHFATWGWLLLRAAAAAVRDNRDDDAEQMLDGAAAAAVRIGARGQEAARSMGPATVDAFGVATVQLKRIETAVIAGQPVRALDLSADVPDGAMGSGHPGERRQLNRHLLDVAWAHAQVGDYAEATNALVTVQRRSPTWLRHQRYARDIVTTIASARKRAMTRELADLAVLVGTDTDQVR